MLNETQMMKHIKALQDTLEEKEFMVETLSINFKKERKHKVLAVFAMSVMASFVLIDFAISYSIYQDKQRLQKEVDYLLEYIEPYDAEVARLQRLGWSNAKIDRYIEDGCVSTLNHGGVK